MASRGGRSAAPFQVEQQIAAVQHPTPSVKPTNSLRACREMDVIGPEVHVAFRRQIALLPRGVFVDRPSCSRPMANADMSRGTSSGACWAGRIDGENRIQSGLEPRSRIAQTWLADGALRGQELKRITVSTTVQPQAITVPRCQAAACGHQGAQPTGVKARRQAAAILLAMPQGPNQRW